jgi:hypothetical protein
VSLADALGMRVAYTMKIGDKRIPWDIRHWALTDPTGSAVAQFFVALAVRGAG